MGLSVASLNPISGLSGVSRVQQKPLNYAIDNQSEVSDSFKDSMKINAPQRVDAAPPVRYATAQIDRDGRQQQNQQVNRAYNDIAGSFNGAVTAYGQDRAGRAYQQIGSQMDLFA